MPSLMETAQKVVADAIPLRDVEFGPWLGSMRSVSADLVPRDYMTAGSDFLWLPRGLEGPAGRSYGTFRRRGGQSIRFDTLPAAAGVGLLPAKWTDNAAPLNAKCRQMEEFKSDSLTTDGVPTLMALVTKEAVASGVMDDGRFSQVYVRDQVGSLNYTLGSEYSSTTYPAVGSAQTYKVVPLWHDSGDGGLSRGTSEFARRFFVPGSRRFLKVGNWTYHPSLYGTPSRWNGERAGGGSALQASDDVTSPEEWESVNTSEVWEGLQTSDDATAYASRSDGAPGVGGTYNHRMLLNGVISATDTSWTVNYRARRTGALDALMIVTFRIVRADGQEFTSGSITPQASWTTSWADYTATISTIGSTGQTANSFVLNAVCQPTGTGNRADITYLTVGSATTTYHNRLMPSGPIPPTHAGTLAKGNVVAGSVAATIAPDADNTDGGWLNESASATNLFASIDETTASDTDYITSNALGAECVLRLSDPGFTPTAGDFTVIVNLRAKKQSSLSAATLSFSLREGVATTRSSSGVPLTASYTNYSFTLTDTEIASITDWTNLYLALYAGGVAGAAGFVSYASITISPTTDLASGWRGNNRFMHAIAYRFEDDSVWAPTVPRFPNDLLTTGLNLFTVDATSPDVRYDKVVWSNLPIGPHGTKSRLLLRTPKIDSTSEDNLQIDPYDLRVVWEIQDNTTTTYDDYFSDDDALAVDAAEAFIRFDHIMPPRSRYIFGGDMRICHSYGGQNPCAIIIAPVGQGADYDLNLPDTSSTAYASQGSWMQIGVDISSAGTLTLIQGNGATATDTKTFAFTTYTTLQKLVDAINATSFAVEGQQWRAQLCPGASPDAATSTLTPHNRAIASCVIDNTAKTITKAAGGLSKVAVGQLVSGAAEETGAVVTVITSDTSLTYTGTLTTGTETLYFYNDLGDAQITDPDTTALGFQRVIANSLPGFLYFTESYLDDVPTYKQRVWMTVASPGAVKAAANNFSGRISNRFDALDAKAGISMGGGGVGQGFVVPFANAIYAITNTRDTGSGIDEEYRMAVINDARGCCAWNTVTQGNKFVPYLTPHGMFAADLDREFFLSEAIFKHPRSDATAGTGDWDSEIPYCMAASAADTDGAYAVSRIMRSALWVNYRDVASSTSLPDRQVVYDFSGGVEHSGLAALVREDGQTPWGWSNELVRAFSAMTAGRRSDGEHLYGWNEANAGSTGDGRIDEFEVGETDNGTEIAATVQTPWLKGKGNRQVSGQEVMLEHTSPASSTGALDFVRSYSEDSYALTPSTSTLVVLAEPKMLPQAARVQSRACRLIYRQITGSAREVRKITLRYKDVRGYK